MDFQKELFFLSSSGMDPIFQLLGIMARDAELPLMIFSREEPLVAPMGVMAGGTEDNFLLTKREIARLP